MPRRLPLEDRTRRRRAGVHLLALSAVILLVLAAAIGLIVAHHASTPAPGRAPGPQTPVPPPQQRPGEIGQWDVAAENALAQRPMLQVPVQAAAPHALTGEIAGPPITLPKPAETQGRWIATGFPPSAEGALAQLKALTETAMDGADPAIVDRAYRELSVPGAPDPAENMPHSTAADLRSSTGMRSSGPVPELVATYRVTHGLIKGTTDDGRFAVVCVLGEIAVDVRGRSAQAGMGECQALRWVHGGWRISPTAAAAPATSAWPGSQEAVRAGYRELRDA